MRVSRSHREAPAIAPGFSFLDTHSIRLERTLLGLLAGPAAASGLPGRRHPPVVLRAKLPRGRGAPLMAHRGGGRHTLLLEEIVGESQGRTKVLPAMGRPILGEVRDRFEGEVRISD